MISTRRIVAAAALAAGVTALAAPLASAAEAPDAGRPNRTTVLDSLAAGELPTGHRHGRPPVSRQLTEVKTVPEPDKLHQVTDLDGPVPRLLPALDA
ncbi:hypothetical protein [Streptomyces sp. NPDC014995]|uniref:hypothetical protein n=1 Tax=Streptomyces sp. NPDC014995 TaxID=3364936 RepID=UPI0036F6E12C